MKTVSLITTLFIATLVSYFIPKNHLSTAFKKSHAVNALPARSLSLADQLAATGWTLPSMTHAANKNATSGAQGAKTLKDAYKDYFKIGAAITPEVDLSDPNEVQHLKTQFNSLTSKQAMQPFWIEPRENSFRWTEADMMVDFAQQNNMAVRGHCLVYALQGHEPKWFYTDNNGEPASKDLMLKRIQNHITKVIHHFKGKVYCWDVVNEAISSKSRGGEYFHPDDQIYNTIGEDYVAKAFQYAHAADPNAKLFYNDHFENAVKRDKIFKLLKGLKDQGVPIDGIGFQCHLGIDGISKDLLQQSIDMFKSIGLVFQVTEIDVSIYKLNIKPEELAPLSQQYSDSVQDQQAAVYKMVFDVCRQNKGEVTGVTFWGSYDNDNERNSMTKRLGKKSYPFLFDANIKPKKAFYNIVNFN